MVERETSIVYGIEKSYWNLFQYIINFKLLFENDLNFYTYLYA